VRIRAYPRAHQLKGAPHVIFKSQRGQLVGGDPIEGELSRPRSLANGTVPHLANPHERFHGRVSGPRANPYRTGDGRPLESPDNSSARDPQSATRSMGVAETSPSVSRRDGEGAFKTSRRARPDRLQRAQARGLMHGYTSYGAPNAGNASYVRVAPPRPTGTLPMPVETNTPHTGGSREKTPAGALTLLQGFGG
jgi:hypothetical protein